MLFVHKSQFVTVLLAQCTGRAAENKCKRGKEQNLQQSELLGCNFIKLLRSAMVKVLLFFFVGQSFLIYYFLYSCNCCALSSVVSAQVIFKSLSFQFILPPLCFLYPVIKS